MGRNTVKGFSSSENMHDSVVNKLRQAPTPQYMSTQLSHALRRPVHCEKSSYSQTGNHKCESKLQRACLRLGAILVGPHGSWGLSADGVAPDYNNPLERIEGCAGRRDRRWRGPTHQKNSK